MSSPFLGQPVRLSLPNLLSSLVPSRATARRRIVGLWQFWVWSQRNPGLQIDSLSAVLGTWIIRSGKLEERDWRPPGRADIARGDRNSGKDLEGEALAHPEHRTGGRLHRAAEDFSVEIRGGRVMQIA